MGKTTFIYALCEPNSRTVRYIGKTATTPQKRLTRHLKESVKLDTHLGRWLRQMASCGGIPGLVILREVPGDGSEAEKRFIRLAKGCRMDLVNSTDGGEGILNPSPELREKRRLARIGKKASSETRRLLREQKLGAKNPQFGRVYSDVEKEKMSALLSGDKNPNFGKTGAASSRFGVPQSLETKEKIGAKLRGKKKTAAHCLALVAAHARRKAAKV